MSYVLFFREFFVHKARKPVFTADSTYSWLKHFLNWHSWNFKKEGAQNLKLWNWVLTSLGWVWTFTEGEPLRRVLLTFNSIRPPLRIQPCAWQWSCISSNRLFGVKFPSMVGGSSIPRQSLIRGAKVECRVL